MDCRFQSSQSRPHLILIKLLNKKIKTLLIQWFNQTIGFIAAENEVEARTDLSRPNRAFWLQNDNIKYISHDSWFSDGINGADSPRRTCVVATIDRMIKHKLTYNRVDCNSQAGYVCVKEAFGKTLINDNKFGIKYIIALRIYRFNITITLFCVQLSLTINA